MTWPPPHTFSGENSDKGDYYSFKEDWDRHVTLKGTSVADQVRHLTRTCLTAILTMIKMISNLTETTEELIAGRFDIVDESPQPWQLYVDQDQGQVSRDTIGTCIRKDLIEKRLWNWKICFLHNKWQSNWHCAQLINEIQKIHKKLVYLDSKYCIILKLYERVCCVPNSKNIENYEKC